MKRIDQSITHDRHVMAAALGQLLQSLNADEDERAAQRPRQNPSRCFLNMRYVRNCSWTDSSASFPGFPLTFF